MRHLQTLRLIEVVARAGSIRKAADEAALTASALNRRIQRFEEEFGFPIFERVPSGMRLNPAGELVLLHYRKQVSDLRRVLSHAADLAGLRRGHVTISVSQALVPFFLPQQIAIYRSEHPGVTFGARVRDRVQAEQDLATFRADLALVFEPAQMVEFEIIHQMRQPVCAVMAKDHPLAGAPEVRLGECLALPHVAPVAGSGVRNLLDSALKRSSRRLCPILETDSFELIRHYVLHEKVLGFHIDTGLETDPALCSSRIAERDLAPGNLILGQLKGRSLPVAASRFGTQLAHALRKAETA